MRYEATQFAVAAINQTRHTAYARGEFERSVRLSICGCLSVCLSAWPMPLAQQWCILWLLLLRNINRRPHAGSQTPGHRGHVATGSC